MTFCKKCQQEMGNGEPFKGSEGVRVNLVLHLGTSLLGESARCDSCHSYIATKWFLFVLPVFPIASYRISETTSLETGTTVYEGRKVSLYKPHLYMMLFVYGLLFILVLYGLYS